MQGFLRNLAFLEQKIDFSPQIGPPGGGSPGGGPPLGGGPPGGGPPWGGPPGGGPPWGGPPGGGPPLGPLGTPLGGPGPLWGSEVLLCVSF